MGFRSTGRQLHMRVQAMAEFAKASRPDVADPYIFTTTTAQSTRIDFPTGWNKNTAVPLVIQSRGVDYDVGGNTFEQSAMATAALNAGWAFATSAFHGNSYGSPAALADLTALVAEARRVATIGPIVLWGNSMGGMLALNAITNGVLVPAGVYLTDAVVDLRNRYDNGRATTIQAAYGIASDGSDYAAKTAGYDPALRPAGDFGPSTLHYREVASSGDTQVVLSAHGSILLGKVGADRMSILDTSDAGHNTAARFIPSDFTAFLTSVLTGVYAPPLVADNFSVAGNLPGSTTTAGGKTWTAVQASNGTTVAATELVKSSGTVGTKTGGVTATTVAYVDTGATSYTVETTLSALNAAVASRGGGLAVRVGSNGFFFWLNTRVNSTTQGYAIYKQQTGTATLVTGQQSTTIIPTAGDRLKAVVTPTTLAFYVNGVQIGTTITDSLNSTSSGAGIFWNATSADNRYDDFARTA